MLTLILGGSASGKSEYAERLVMDQPGPHIYLATMEPWGEEGAGRVQKHRASRRRRDFLTVERYIDLSSLSLPSNSSILLEDLGNLTANELFRPVENALDAYELAYRLVVPAGGSGSNIDYCIICSDNLYLCVVCKKYRPLQRSVRFHRKYDPADGMG